MKQKILSALAIIIFTGGLVLAQEDVSLSNTQTKSEANAAAIYNQGDNNSVSTTNRQFISSQVPFVYPIPGNVPSGKTKRELVIPFNKDMTVEEMENAAKKTTNPIAEIVLPWRWGGKKRIFPVVINKWGGPQANTVKFVDWDPYQGGYKDDLLLGAVTVVGEAWWPERRFMAEGVKMCREMKASRVAAFRHEVIASKTETGVKGLSLGGASVNGSNDVALGSAIGYGKGTSLSYPETWPIYELVCLNDGPASRPVKKDKEEEKETLRSEPKSKPEPETKVEPVLNKALEALNHSMALVEKMMEKSAPPAPAPLPNISEAKIVDSCETLPEFEIIFDFDKSFIKPQYLPQIKKFSDWLQSHSSCQVQVEGHASSEGTYDYNAALGRRRSKAVYDVLVSPDPQIANRIEQFVSVGKDKPRSEYLPENRRVLIRIIGAASGK